jgi:hypothetical protein
MKIGDIRYPKAAHGTNSKGANDFRRAGSFASWRDVSVRIDFGNVNCNWLEDIYV